MLEEKTKESLIRRATIRAKIRGRQGLRNKPVSYQYPKGLERKYVKTLRDVIRSINKKFNDTIMTQLPRLMEEARKLNPQNEVRKDSWATKIIELSEAMTLFGDREVSSVDIMRFAAMISDYNDDQLGKVFRSVLGVDVLKSEPWLGPLLESFAHENRKLIVSLEQRHLADLEGIIQRGLQDGKSINLLKQDVRRRYGIAERHARLIARDQVGKLNGQLTKQRQAELGVKKFIWRTVKDERVREEHQELEGKVFEWDKPPSEGYPGQPINCRCIAEPVLDDILKEVKA